MVGPPSPFAALNGHTIKLSQFNFSQTTEGMMYQDSSDTQLADEESLVKTRNKQSHRKPWIEQRCSNSTVSL